MLFIFGDACARIFAEQVETIVLVAVAQTDMPFLGKLHCVGQEVRQNLLYATGVDGGDKRFVGIVLPELHFGLFDALLQCEADIVEHSGKVYLLRLDADDTIGQRRGIDDVVDKSLQHVTRVSDNTHIFSTFRRVGERRQHTRKAYDGIQWRAQFMSHRCHESALHPDALAGLFRHNLQFLTGLHKVRDVDRNAEVACHFAVLVAYRFAAYFKPSLLRTSRCVIEVVDVAMEVVVEHLLTIQYLKRALAVFFCQITQIGIEIHTDLWLAKLTVEV